MTTTHITQYGRGPKIERKYYPVTPRREQGRRGTATVAVGAALIGLAYDFAEWLDEKCHAVYIERRP